MSCWVVSVYLPVFYIPHLICWGPVSGPCWNRGVTARERDELRAQKSLPPGRARHICSTLLIQEEDHGRGWNLPITHTWHNHEQRETFLHLLRISHVYLCNIWEESDEQRYGERKRTDGQTTRGKKMTCVKQRAGKRKGGSDTKQDREIERERGWVLGSQQSTHSIRQ